MRRTASTMLVCAIAIATLGVASATGACTEAPAATGEWTSSGADLANTRTQPQGDAIDVTAAGALEPAWVVNVVDAGGRGDMTGTPAVAGGCVFVGTNLGTVLALDADSGDSIWTTDLGAGASINSSAAVADGVVYVHVNEGALPSLVALRASDGATLWSTPLSEHEGISVWSSPVVWNGLVFSGIAGGTTDNDVSGGSNGSYTIVDSGSGALLHRGWTVPTAQQDTFKGGSILSTAAVDAASGYAYVGTDGISSADQSASATHPHMSSIMKIDVDPSRETFGEVVGSGKGIERLQEDNAIFALDIQASPNLMMGPDGSSSVGAMHKGGTYEAFETESMSPTFSTLTGAPSPVGGLSTAYDGTSVYGANMTGGTIFAIDPATGLQRWLMPLADGAHLVSPPSVTNGVVFSLDTTGGLNAFDAATGVPLLKRPLILGTDIAEATPIMGSGIAIARDTVYVGTGTSMGDHGYVMAFHVPQT